MLGIHDRRDVNQAACLASRVVAGDRHVFDVAGLRRDLRPGGEAQLDAEYLQLDVIHGMLLGRILVWAGHVAKQRAFDYRCF